MFNAPVSVLNLEKCAKKERWSEVDIDTEKDRPREKQRQRNREREIQNEIKTVKAREQE